MNITTRLGEGATLHYLPTDRFTTDYFSVHFILPLAKETVTAYSLLAKLFKRGCRAYPTQGALAKRLEELYSSSLSISSSKQGERQMISFWTDVLSARFLPAGEAVSDAMHTLLKQVVTDPCLENGAFPLSTVEREKVTLRAQLRAAVNDKRRLAVQRCREIMCEGEAYSLALEGTEADIDAATPASLYHAYKQMLCEAEIEMFYSGSEPYDVAEARARDLLAHLGARAPKRSSTTFQPQATSCREVTEEIDATQGKLAIGFRTGITESATQKELDALLLFNMIYGTSPVSKLFMNVRERLSLCYYCSSMNDNLKGVMIVQSGIENDKKDTAVAEILHQLEEIRAGNVTEEEMLCAKQAFRDLSRSVEDSPSSLEQWYLKRTLHGDGRTPAQMNADIEALTLADVVSAAERITPDTVFFLKGVAPEETDDE